MTTPEQDRALEALIAWRGEDLTVERGPFALEVTTGDDRYRIWPGGGTYSIDSQNRARLIDPAAELEESVR